MAAPIDKTSYVPKDVFTKGFRAAAFAGGLGFVFSAVQNSLSKHSYGAMGVLTRTGGTVGFLAAAGAAFAMTEAAVANNRQVNDPMNGAAAGCVVGFMTGMKARSIPTGLAACAVLGAFSATFDYTGGTLAGSSNESMEQRRNRFLKVPPKPLVERADAV